MRSIVICIVFMSVVFVGRAQEGVKFEDLTFEQALEKAKEEKKLVFMDCYTQWCGACKVMLNTVFREKAAGEFFNSRFICLKRDMEAGEGVGLAKRYGVKGFPTFLLIRPDGTEQHRILGGSSDLGDFIAWVKTGAKKETSLDYLTKLYASGKMKKKQLRDYHWALHYAGFREKDKEIMTELAGKLSDKDWLREDFSFLLGEIKYGDDRFKYMIENLSSLRKNYKEQKSIDSWLYSIYGVRLKDYLYWEEFRTDEGLGKLGKICQEVEMAGIQDDERLKSAYMLAVDCMKKDAEKIVLMLEDAAFREKEGYVRLVLSSLDYMADKVDGGQARKVVESGERIMKQWDIPGLREVVEKYKR
ncbi:thioredoxin family protein [Butyricimonas synergistica]|uniref:thioredoxin family protein n=1 Tax=Butyricimonas synergistica TaxID=544644 RepID=UPI0022E836FE|nr:thioredoxin domain-containing protein [Butyricimonas synergistica]